MTTSTFRPQNWRVSPVWLILAGARAAYLHIADPGLGKPSLYLE